MKYNNVLIIGDTHLPFTKKGYLDFCIEIKNKWKCNKVVHIGDLVDNHSISYHEHDPNGMSPADEMAETDKHLKGWFKAFPRVFLCRGNHDSLVGRKGRTSGLPERCFLSFRDIWNLPKGWKDDWEWEIDGVLYKHGLGCSGKRPHALAAVDAGQPVVIGHLHSILAMEYIITNKDAKFGMCVGCGIDRKQYAFRYGKDMRYKPIIGCGVVLGGEVAVVERMKL
jgi:predicted phosphodiesterase